MSFIRTVINAPLALLKLVLKFALALIAMAAGAILMLYLFASDLPLGDPPKELTENIGGPYLDMHTHVAGLGKRGSGCFVSESLLGSYKYYFYQKALGVSREELEREGDHLVVNRLSELVRTSKYVNKAVVLAMDGVIDENGELNREETEIYVPNDFLAKEVAKHDNLLFGASVNPYRRDALLRLVRAAQEGAVLLKWIPSIQRIDPSDPAITPFYESLVQLNLPLLVHSGHEASFTKADNTLADPLKLELPLKLGVRVIAAHAASSGKNEGVSNFDRLMPLFEKYPNLYADISSLTQINRLGSLPKVLRVSDTVSKRLVYGSDWPLQFFPLVSPWYHLRHAKPSALRWVDTHSNPFDRDVTLKRAIGVSPEILARSATLINRSIHTNNTSSPGQAIQQTPPSAPAEDSSDNAEQGQQPQ